MFSSKSFSQLTDYQPPKHMNMKDVYRRRMSVRGFQHMVKPGYISKVLQKKKSQPRYIHYNKFGLTNQSEKFLKTQQKRRLEKYHILPTISVTDTCVENDR